MYRELQEEFSTWFVILLLQIFYILRKRNILNDSQIQRKNLRTRNIKMLVIDEADEMLNKGFKEQIYDIYRYLPPTTQVVLVSATLPQEVLDMTKKFMNEPVRILVKRDELTVEVTIRGHAMQEVSQLL